MYLTKKILLLLGLQLIGKTILTLPMGGWPGGLCTITKIEPDPAAPEIVFNVKNIITGEEIGMFDDEFVVLITLVTA